MKRHIPVVPDLDNEAGSRGTGWSMWVIVGLGGLFAVLGLLTLAFPARATDLNTRFSNERARQADSAHWWGRSSARIRFAGVAMLLVGVAVVGAGFIGGHHAR